MKSIGIKLADGSFHPLLEEGTPGSKNLYLTTVQDNQTTVHVDLYRSETNSMDDAEYVDTLEIRNLNPHENGEPTINLQIELDENNELSAKVRDLETGKNSETTVTLMSRTLQDRNTEPVNFSIDETKEPEETTEPETSENLSDSTLADAAIIDSSDFELPADTLNDLPSEESSGNQEEASDLSDLTISEDELSLSGVEDNAQNEDEDTQLIGPSPNDEEFSFDDIPEVSEEKDSKKESESDEIFTDDFALPDFGTAEENPETETQEEDSSADFAAGTFDDIEETVEEEPVAEEPAEEEPEIEVPVTEDEAPAVSADDFSLPDFDSVPLEEESVPEETASETTEEAAADEFNMPDFDSTPLEEESVPDETVPESSLTEDNASAEDFSLPDFDDASDDTSAAGAVGLGGVFDDDFGEVNLDSDSDDESFKTKDPTFQPKNEMFTGLYDKETIEGGSTYEEVEEIKKKTRKPVIICIVCAIICIIAVLLLLFIIPSPINLLSKDITPAEETAAEETADTQEEAEDGSEDIPDESEPEVSFEIEEPEPEPEPEPPAPVEEAKPAVEDQIVVAKQDEVVVPEVPVKVKKEDITYKIKWGDTLWDISAAYYKNPWRYKFLARYNNIRNPDRIISGRYIKIPQE